MGGTRDLGVEGSPGPVPAPPEVPIPAMEEGAEGLFRPSLALCLLFCKADSG